MRPMLVLFVACAAAAPAADHMLVIEDSTDVTFEAALGVMTKFGIDRKTAETILHHLDEKGAAVAAQGPKEACERLAKEFSEIGVKSSVRPNAYSPDLVPDNSEYAESDVEELSVTRLNELMKSDAVARNSSEGKKRPNLILCHPSSQSVGMWWDGSVGGRFAS